MPVRTRLLLTPLCRPELPDDHRCPFRRRAEIVRSLAAELIQFSVRLYTWKLSWIPLYSMPAMPLSRGVSPAARGGGE